MHRSWLLYTSFIQRSQVFLEEWLVVGPGQGKNKMTPNLVVTENKYSKNDRDMSMEYISHFKGALTGQVQENLRIKILIRKLDGNSMNIRIHEFTLI